MDYSAFTSLANDPQFAKAASAAGGGGMPIPMGAFLGMQAAGAGLGALGGHMDRKKQEELEKERMEEERRQAIANQGSMNLRDLLMLAQFAQGAFPTSKAGGGF